MPTDPSQVDFYPKVRDAISRRDLALAARLMIAACLPRPPQDAAQRIEIASLLQQLFACARDEQGVAYASQLVAQPDLADACYALGHHLVARGLAPVGVVFLAHAIRTYTDNPAYWMEYLAALDRTGQHTQALKVLSLQPELTRKHQPIRAMQAFHRLMSGDLLGVRADLDLLGDPRDPFVTQTRSRLHKVLTRAQAISPPYALNPRDLAGWHMALNGSILLHVSPDAPEKMRGRYAALHASTTLVHGVLARAIDTLERLSMRPPRIFALPDRHSTIVGGALARLLRVPCQPFDTGVTPGLVIAWDLDHTDPKLIPHLQAYTSGRPLLVMGTRWTDPPLFAPDLTGWLHQSLRAPWPDDGTDDQDIIEQILQTDLPNLYIDASPHVAAHETLATLGEAQYFGPRRTKGTRPILWEGAPVISARFL